MSFQNQKCSSSSTLYSGKSAAAAATHHTPVDMHYMRRVAVKQQKQHVIMHNLLDLSVYYFIAFALVYSISIVVIFPVQILLFVRKTALNFVCTGVWVSLVYAVCLASLYLLEKRRSYEMLMLSFGCNLGAIVASISGLICVNIIDMAFFNTECINGCDVYSYQFLNLIMIVFGAVGFSNAFAFILLIELKVMRESRKMNLYLENRK